MKTVSQSTFLVNSFSNCLFKKQIKIFGKIFVSEIIAAFVSSIIEKEHEKSVLWLLTCKSSLLK